MPRTRYEHGSTAPPLTQLPAAALRAVLREGYGLAALRQDLLAGAVVGVVALPLAMALAIAVGVAPQIERLRVSHCRVVVCGLQEQPAAVLQKSELSRPESGVLFCPDIESAIPAAERALSRASMPVPS